MNRAFYTVLRFAYAVREGLRRRFTPMGLGVLTCLDIAGVIGIDTNQSLSYQVFTYLLALLGVAITASFFIHHRFAANRILPRFGTVGVPLKYRILLQNKTRKPQKGLKLLESFSDTCPSFQEFREIAVLPKHRNIRRQWIQNLARRRRAIAPAVEVPTAAQEETEVLATITPLRRGLLQFKTLTVACPDPLGLVNACSHIALPQSVLILPKRYRLPPISLPGSRHQQSGGVPLASCVSDSEEFRSLRDYQPGDPLRKIHWKSWAKVGRPVVRDEQDEYFVRHALILDTFQSELYSEALEEAISIAASLTCEVQTQESLLDLMFVGLESHCFTVGRGLGQTEQMLELLASVVPCRDRPFASILPLVQSRYSLLSGCICVLLAWDNDRQALVQQLQAMNVPTMVLIVADERSTTAHPALECIKDPRSSVHLLRLGQVQQGLLKL